MGCHAPENFGRDQDLIPGGRTNIVWSLDCDEKLVEEGWPKKNRTQILRLLEIEHLDGLFL